VSKVSIVSKSFVYSVFEKLQEGNNLSDQVGVSEYSIEQILPVGFGTAAIDRR
jgi:hypothetical protein